MVLCFLVCVFYKGVLLQVMSEHFHVDIQGAALQKCAGWKETTSAVKLVEEAAQQFDEVIPWHCLSILVNGRHHILKQTLHCSLGQF